METLVDNAIAKIANDLLGVFPSGLATKNASAFCVAFRFYIRCRVECETQEWDAGGDTGEGIRLATYEDVNRNAQELIEQCQKGTNRVVFDQVAQFIKRAPLDASQRQVVHEQVLSCVVTCPTCGGEKTVDCPNAACRQGQVRCSCGNGQVNCYHCDGHGKKNVDETCYACFGFGGRNVTAPPNSFHREIWQTCGVCRGHRTLRKRAICKSCYGSGYQTCGTCGGAGYYTCNQCDGCGIVDCGVCASQGQPTGVLTHCVRTKIFVQRDGQSTIRLVDKDCPSWITQYIAGFRDEFTRGRELAKAVCWNEETALVASDGKSSYLGEIPGELTGIEAVVEASGTTSHCKMLLFTDGEINPYSMESVLDDTVAQLTQAAKDGSDSSFLRTLLNCQLGNWAVYDLRRSADPGFTLRDPMQSTGRLPSNGVVSREKFNAVLRLVKAKADRCRQETRFIPLMRTLGNLGAWFPILLGGALVTNFILPAEIDAADLGASRALSDLLSLLAQGISALEQGARSFAALFLRPTVEIFLWCAFAAIGTFLLFFSSVKCFGEYGSMDRPWAWPLFGLGALISGPALLHDSGISAFVFMLLAILAAHAWRQRWRVWKKAPIWVVTGAVYATLVGPQHLRSGMDAVLGSPIDALLSLATTVGILIAHAGALTILILLFARKSLWSPARFWKWLLCYGIGWCLFSSQLGLLQEAPAVPNTAPRGVWVTHVLFDLLLLAGWSAILRARRHTYSTIAHDMQLLGSAPFARLLDFPDKQPFNMRWFPWTRIGREKLIGQLRSLIDRRFSEGS